MSKTYIPADYAPLLNLYDTQKATALLKRVFEDTLCGNLHLRRVSAPLFVEAASGLNDNLNGVEPPSPSTCPPPSGTPRWSSPWLSGSVWPCTTTTSPWARVWSPT